jgi:hypothetical protein
LYCQHTQFSWPKSSKTITSNVHVPHFFSFCSTDYDMIRLIEPTRFAEFKIFKKQFVDPIVQGQSTSASRTMSTESIHKLNKLHKIMEK